MQVQLVAGMWYTLFVSVVWNDDFEGIRRSNTNTILMFLSGRDEEIQGLLEY
jgi:hypothetical protein